MFVLEIYLFTSVSQVFLCLLLFCLCFRIQEVVQLLPSGHIACLLVNHETANDRVPCTQRLGGGSPGHLEISLVSLNCSSPHLQQQQQQQ